MRNTIAYVVRRDRPKDLGIFGFDFLLPDEIRLRHDDGCYETALEAEVAAEERFRAFKIVKATISDIFVICANRRHGMAVEFLEKSIAGNEGITTLDTLKRCPPEYCMELSYIVRGLV